MCSSRFQDGAGVEVVGLPEEVDVGQRQAGGHRRAAELLKQLWGEHEIAGHRAGRGGEEQCRQEPPRSPHVELLEAEDARLNLLLDQPGNEEPADDEEDVDAQEAPGEGREARVE